MENLPLELQHCIFNHVDFFYLKDLSSKIFWPVLNNYIYKCTLNITPAQLADELQLFALTFLSELFLPVYKIQNTYYIPNIKIIDMVHYCIVYVYKHTVYYKYIVYKGTEIFVKCILFYHDRPHMLDVIHVGNKHYQAFYILKKCDMIDTSIQTFENQCWSLDIHRYLNMDRIDTCKDSILPLVYTTLLLSHNIPNNRMVRNTNVCLYDRMYVEYFKLQHEQHSIVIIEDGKYK